ncbi:MAG: precorrin-6y C5,15-methyltransferase (decarboxylating) subunit CbiE [Pseudomonadota bacterium]
MKNPWLDVVGVGEDGLQGLRAPARAALDSAEVIIGGDRHQALLPDSTARRVAWPTPFRSALHEIRGLRGRRVVVLVVGDPLWFSAGRYFAEMFPAEEVRFHPQISAFQLAATRMGWSLADVETLTIHGRPAEQIIPYFSPGARMLVLTQDADSPAEVAKLLAGRGFGPSRLSVLGALGGERESRRDGLARTWEGPSPEFHILAIECVVEPAAVLLPLTGLPTERLPNANTPPEIRALAVAALSPRRGEMLWAFSGGSGAVAIEWMRAARDAEAMCVIADEAQAEAVMRAAYEFGTPRLKCVTMGGLPEGSAPDAIFLGGEITARLVETVLAHLSGGGRIVAQAAEALGQASLLAARKAHGGTLRRVAVSEPDGRGRYGVLQWVLWR